MTATVKPISPLLQVVVDNYCGTFVPARQAEARVLAPIIFGDYRQILSLRVIMMVTERPMWPFGGRTQIRPKIIITLSAQARDHRWTRPSGAIPTIIRRQTSTCT